MDPDGTGRIDDKCKVQIGELNKHNGDYTVTATLDPIDQTARKEVLKPVTSYNVLGRSVAFARVRAVDDGQGIVICDLSDANGRLLATDRYFYTGRAPFAVLTPTERDLLIPPPRLEGLTSAPVTG